MHSFVSLVYILKENLGTNSRKNQNSKLADLLVLTHLSKVLQDFQNKYKKALFEACFP